MSASSSSSSWQPPSWSHIPPTTQQWHLDELKNGHVVATHSLNDILTTNNSNNRRRRCITFGRIPDPSQIDIQTAHESCSRLHARIAFTAHGIPYLKDLGSNNGTFVNNVRLPMEACGKWEYTADNNVEGKGGNNNNREARGSRGVVIYPGDAIKFGCSTRIFVLEGPEEFERGAAAATSLQEKRSVAQQDAALLDVDEKNEDNDDDAICSWGMSTVECSDEQQQQQQEEKQGEFNSNNSSLPSIEAFFTNSNNTYNNIKYTISNPLQQLYNQYQSKTYKYNSISTESQRISQKEDGGVELSDGQRNQLGKNQEKLRVLEDSLKELQRKIEEGMYVAIYGRVPLMTSASSTRRRKRDDDDGYADEDEDDFYDRTTTNTAAANNGNYKDKEAESEESLIQKWKDLLQSYSKQQNVLSSTIKRSNELQRQIDQAEDDDEDVFFIQNDLNLVKENITKATCRVEEITKELYDTECLLKIVNDKLKWDREEGLIGVDLPMKAAKMKDCGDDGEIQEKNTTMDTDIVERGEQKSESMMMPPPPKMIVSASSAAATSFDMMPPPPPKGTMNAASSMTITSANEIEGVVIPEHRESLQKTTVGETVLGPTQNKKRQLGPMRPPPTSTTGGTLAALQQFSASPNDPNNAKKQKKSKCDNSGNAISFNSPRTDVWTAPTDQDGSGRTSLHDKFKGRY